MRWAALVAAGGLALTGCSSVGGDSNDRGAQPSMSTTSAAAQEDSAATSASSAKDSSKAAGKNSSRSQVKTPTGTHLARTVRLSLDVEDVEQASAKVRSAATDAGGFVSSEESRLATTKGGRSWAEITVSVPVDKLDATITDLSDVGTVTQRTSTTEDLSSQYTDTAARVRTLKKSVERLQKLIDTTSDLDQIVTLESELSTREADLESMTSQQKTLEKRMTTAPITVSLATPSTQAEDEPEEETGFLAGLSDGWGTFTSALEGGLTALGAITPFALTFAVLAAPVVWWVRRRTHRPAQVVATTEE